MKNSNKRSKTLYLLPVILGTTLVMSGCFGGSTAEQKKEIAFSDTNVYTQKEHTDLTKKEKSLLNQAAEQIKAADFTIQNVFLKDLDRNFYYEGILSMDTDAVYQQQLKYFEVHRKFMLILEEKNADKETLLLQNRVFYQFLETYRGRSIEGKAHIKRAQLRIFERYNILELDAILNGKSGDLAKLYKEEVKREDKVKMWEWFKKEKNANFKEDILVHTKITFDLLEPSDQDSTIELNNLLKQIDNLTNYPKTKKESLSNMEKIKKSSKKINELRFTKEAEWIKTLGLNLASYKYELYEEKVSRDELGAADSRFFFEAGYQDSTVFFSMLDGELAKQTEKRKAKKEEMSKESNK